MEQVVQQAVESLSLASRIGHIRRILDWLYSLYDREAVTAALSTAFQAHKYRRCPGREPDLGRAGDMSSRTAALYLSAMVESGTVSAETQGYIESLFERIAPADIGRIPKSAVHLAVGGEATPGRLRMAAYFGQLLPPGYLAQWIGDFKGTAEELEAGLAPIEPYAVRSDASLKAAVERVLLRNSRNGCIIVRDLELLELVADQMVPLLSSETDAVREAALEAFRANTVTEPVQAKLIAAFTAKGSSVKVRISLSEAIALGPRHATDFVCTAVAKEANEVIVDNLLAVHAGSAACYAQFKAAKLPLKTVLVKHMPPEVLAEHAKQIYDLVVKESAPGQAEAAPFVCVSLARLSGLPLDWTRFIQEADSRPTGLLRQLASYPADCQRHAVDWLLSDAVPAQNASVARALAAVALHGAPQARRHVNVRLRQREAHGINVAECVREGGLNAHKLCQSLLKTEQHALAVFGACHRLGLDWVRLAARLCTDLAGLLERHFDELYDAGSAAALATLARYAPGPLAAKVRGTVEAVLGSLEGADVARQELIWVHKDVASLAVPLGAGQPGAKLDAKAEKALAAEALARENGIRAVIASTLGGLDTAAVLARFADCEDLAIRVVPFLASGLYGAAASRLMYALARQWRPLAVSYLLRTAGGDAWVSRDWNMASMASMEESIKRLCVATRPGEAGVLLCFPVFAHWIQRGQYDFVRPLADRLEDAGGLARAQAGRLVLVQALLGFANRTPDVDRIMGLLGGPIAGAAEAQLFLAALFSEQPAHRKTALEALHGTWSVGPGLAEARQLRLAVDLLRYDELSMEVATVVSLKMAESGAAPDPAEEAQALCQIFETRAADSWAIEAAKEAIAALDAQASIPVLMGAYDRLLRTRRPEVVNVRSKDLDLTCVPRAAVVEALGMVSLPGDLDTVLPLYERLVLELFLDPSGAVYENALQAAIALLEGIPAERMERSGHALGALFEGYLGGSVKARVAGATVTELDRVRVFVIILLGKVSQYMAHDADRRRALVATLMATLATPAENVQCAVAEALVPLFRGPHAKEGAQWIDGLKAALYDPQGTMASRRGAAYGVAALAKARGLVAIREWELLAGLLGPFRPSPPKGEARPTAEAKEGALFGMELLARFLGQAFEPYVMKTVDAVLAGFSDSKAEVREATMDAARALMGCVGSSGARLLLPALLSRATLDEANWRSRVGVLEWLGAMASMAPSVLAARLPDIIPVLIETGLNDSHGQVQATARRALVEYGRAVANPEMRGLVPAILEALANPSASTIPCFRRILETQFMHVIDGPSLALLEPLLRRALTDRSSGAASLKKLAGQIIGNLATSLVDAADFGPYLGTLVPALCGCLGDPVPQVRAHAAKVIGMLVQVAEVDGRKATLAQVGGLFPALEAQMLTSNETNSNDIDRAGAAQALAEILAAKGIAYAAGVLADRLRPFLGSRVTLEKEGGLLVLGYLPGAFDFYERLESLYHETCMPELLVAVLELTADEAESVRDSASKTSKSLIDQFVGAGIDRAGVFRCLLAGFGSARWRVRLACLSMLEKAMTTYDEAADDAGDLAEGVIRVARLPTAEELEATRVLDKASIQVLQTRLFLGRFDPASSQLRSSALNLWKALSYHSPRTLSEILPLLVEECAKPAAVFESADQVQRALEDLFVKLGDRLAIPFLAQSLALWAQPATSKPAVLNNLVTLVGILGSTPGLLTKLLMEEAVRRVVQMVSLGLTDADEEAQSFAAKLFDALLDELLVAPEQAAPIVRQIVGSEGFTNDALLLLVGYKPAQVLPVVIPTVVAGLPSEAGLAFLGEIFDTAGNDAAAHVIPTVKALLAAYGTADELLEDTLCSVIASLNPDGDAGSDTGDDSGSDYGDYDSGHMQDTVFHLRFGQLLEAQMELGAGGAAWAYLLVRLYCEGSPHLDHSRLYPIWVARLLTCCFTSGGADADAARATLLALLEQPSPGHLPGLIQLVRSTAGRLERGRAVPLTAWHTPLLAHLTKAVLLPVLTQAAGLPAADAELAKAFAAEIATSLLRLSASASAAGSWGASVLTLLVGALIRVCSDRRACDSRTAAYHALGEAVRIHPSALRPFFPQLQRLFAQAVTGCQADGDEAAAHAAAALTRLLPHLPRPEALLQEWAAILAVAEDPAQGVTEDNIQRVALPAKTAMLRCLAAAFAEHPALGPKLAHLKGPLIELLRALAAHADEAVRLANARLIDALGQAGLLGPAERASLLEFSALLK